MHQHDDEHAISDLNYMQNNHLSSCSGDNMTRWMNSQQHLLQQQQAYQHMRQGPNSLPGCMDPRGLDSSLHYLRQQTPGSRKASPSYNDARASPSLWSVLGEDQFSDSANQAGEAEESEVNLPYNQLLYNCFMSMPQKECLLKDIYDWFRINTNKADNPRQKGWQNSIRHNLSMNKAFERGSRVNPKDTPANSWLLTDEAIRCGVEPTTRFRNPQRPISKSRRGRELHLTRQVSGSKGGHAARYAARPRNQRSGIRSQSPADLWAAASSRHSTPFPDDDAHAVYGQPMNDVSRFGLGMSGIDLHGNLNSTFNYSNPNAYLTSCPTNYAPYYNSSAAGSSLNPANLDMDLQAYSDPAHGAAQVSPEGFYAGFNRNQWMEPSPEPSVDVSVTPMSDTGLLDPGHLSGMPSDIKPGNLFGSFTPPPSVPATPEPQVQTDMEKSLGDDFFNIGNNDSLQN